MLGQAKSAQMIREKWVRIRANLTRITVHLLASSLQSDFHCLPPQTYCSSGESYHNALLTVLCNLKAILLCDLSGFQGRDQPKGLWKEECSVKLQ